LILFQFKPSWPSQEIPSLKSQNPLHELSGHLGANRSIWPNTINF
jgi:hypothetical protein